MHSYFCDDCFWVGIKGRGKYGMGCYGKGIWEILVSKVLRCGELWFLRFCLGNVVIESGGGSVSWKTRILG